MSDRKIVNVVRQMISDYPINPDFLASEFIKFYWNKYNEGYTPNNSVNGGVFEQLLILA